MNGNSSSAAIDLSQALVFHPVRMYVQVTVEYFEPKDRFVQFAIDQIARKNQLVIYFERPVGNAIVHLSVDQSQPYLTAEGGV